MSSSKSQVSFEFAVVLFAVIIVTVAFGIIAGNRLLELKSQQTNVQLQNVALTVRNEIDIAHAVESGYLRTFTLPDYIGNDNYTVIVGNSFVTVSMNERELSMSVQPISGTIRKGLNVISKANDSVILNG